MMRTPTYQTINYTHPEVVQLANRLCSRGSITDGYPERDACYVLDGIFGERNFIYWDKGRELPQYAGDILQDLNRQFGQVRIRLALRQSREFSDLLDLSEKIAYDWEKREHSKDGTVRIDAFSRIELGLRKLEKLVTENKDGKDPMLGAIERLCNIKSRERLPYRAKQYSLRGIPIALPQRLPY